MQALCFGVRCQAYGFEVKNQISKVYRIRLKYPSASSSGDDMRSHQPKTLTRNLTWLWLVCRVGSVCKRMSPYRSGTSRHHKDSTLESLCVQ